MALERGPPNLLKWSQLLLMAMAHRAGDYATVAFVAGALAATRTETELVHYPNRLGRQATTAYHS